MILRIDLSRHWLFRRLEPNSSELTASFVDLPHSPFIADLDGREHWFGECEYERELAPPILAAGERCVLWIGAAMQVARIFIDQQELDRHEGGYLPFEVDLTDSLRGCSPVRLRIRVDNRHNADIPPGKPYDDLDFCWYGGLYRSVELRIKTAVHITDPVAADEIAGGGVFLRTLEASPNRAVVSVKTHLRNTAVTPHAIQVRVSLRHDGKDVACTTSDPIHLDGMTTLQVEQSLAFDHPRLWSPSTPVLHEAVVTVLDSDGAALDSQRERFGVRRIAFSRSGGFTINGHRLRLRGTNRHQEHPYAGYAVPRAAQHRDVRRIKEAGFDYVRLSHYPQSPDFLDACDELGVVVMNCIPGWQFMGGERFRELCYQNAREVIRRDRNHPCVVLWELSLNETKMDEPFMARQHAIGHEEFPGDQMFTCGWQDRFDVFIHSRQHGEIHRWQNGDKALVIAEYGDWEFYASNEGFDQKTGAGVFASWSHGRKQRQDGERGLRQQVSNHVIALNDTLSSPAVLDGQWSMFDYPRGYDPIRAACGVMDIFRLPKFSYFFYRSQRDPDEAGLGWRVGPVVFIASHWTPASDLRIPVFSNCDEVELRLNGSIVSRERPAKTAFTQHLPHAPFVFHLPRFSPGTLEAVGYLDGRARAEHIVATPGAPAALNLVVDDLCITAAATEPDLLCVHAELRDADGMLCVEETTTVRFVLEGDAAVLGPLTRSAEAGIASIAVRLPGGSTGFELNARSKATGETLAANICWRRNSGETTRKKTGGAFAVAH